MIEFINIEKSYGNEWAIEDFNLKIEKGEFVTIIGSSGSGKTTIIKMVNGLIKPDSGTIIVEDKDI
ncbi:MAG: ATP-binding cassette domain-containing protein, partial [Clostridiaceae bacterium]|nr:ATP-binding cassette domain-containing protein [Clostridiaceae bacterium]